MAIKLVNDGLAKIGRQEIAERLQAAVERAGGVSVVAKGTGLPISTFHTWISGAAEPKITAMAKISNFLGVSLDDLISGPESQTLITGTQNSDSITVPMLDVFAAAGGGITNDGEREITKLPFSRALLRELGARPEKCHFIRARGDSMEPTIHDGDIVLIDTGRSKDREDGIYVLMLGEDARIKRCGFGAFGQLILMSDNPAYPPEQVSRAEREQIKIIGKVIWTGGVV